jgi:septum formation protein
MELVLASSSPYRRALLERLSVPFRWRTPPVDEASIKVQARGAAPRALAERLAEAKATSLAHDEPDAILIGSDQLVALDGRILGKPGDPANAIAQLTAMAGRTHELITALAVWHQGNVLVHTDVTRMHMRALSPQEIARYVQADQPLDCAGSYKIEERGVVLFERIESEDQTAITGLPLIALTTILREIGFAIP